ncbi:acylase [Alteromonadaceae bacterium M269]|nr:acylase [Alteromonadaceae bacterium M269]
MSRAWIKYCVVTLVVVGIGLGIWLYNPLPENPSVSMLEETAKPYHAEIIRDEWGVPHIVGKTDADAAFGLAYAHAEDDYQTIQNVVAATRGVLARYNGAKAAPTDYIVSLLNVWPTLKQRYETDVPEDVKALAEAYAVGLNLYAARNLDKTWQGLAPFQAEDIVAGFMFKTPFFYGLDKTLLSLFDDERQAEISLASWAKGDAFEVSPRSGYELGSNGIAVSAERSGDNTTRLLINSHQPLTGPVAWYEAHIKSEQGLDIMGGLFPGTPVILHGFNHHLGWASTVNYIDLADTYILTRNPDNDMQYRMDNEWLDFDVQQVEIEVRLFGPFAFKAKRSVLRTIHGPVIEGKNDTYALRYAGMGEIRQLEQYYRLNQASNLDEFMGAMRMNALPSINYIYADQKSNIGFIHNAQYPDRKAQGDWSKDIPGDRSDLIWNGYLSFDSVPKLINPESGLVFNSNNTPFTATDGPDNLEQAHFAKSMGLATEETNRSQRILELTDGKRTINKSRLLDIKFDHSYSKNSEEYRAIHRMIQMDWSQEPELQSAVSHLEAWDRSMNVDNRYAALAGMILNDLTVTDNLTNPTDVDLKSALSKAVNHLNAQFGKLDVAWGEVNQIKRGDVSAPVDGGPDTLRAIYSIDSNSEETYATNGDSWIAVVEWPQSAETGGVRADVIHQFGAATNTPSSKHYNDQLQQFAEKQWRHVNFDMNRIRATAEKIYKVGVN